MASVFQIQESSHYVIDYTDANGRRRRVFTGLTRRKDALRAKECIEQGVLAVRNGFVTSLSAVIEERMQQPILQSIEAYQAYLLTQKVDCKQYVRQVIKHLKRVFRICDVNKLADLVGYRGTTYEPIDEAVTAHLSAIQPRIRRPYATSTRNAKLGELRAFCQWAIRTQRLSESAIMKIPKQRDVGDRRRQRRPLTDEEIHRLLVMTRRQGARGGIDVRSRAMLYRVAIETGLRRGELASLTKTDFVLDSEPPYILLKARHAKSRKETKQPIPSDLAKALRPFLERRSRRRPVWRIPRHAASMLRRDLAVAGIPVKDKDGHVVDFHALRHTYITRLSRAGIPLAHAQRLARHSNVQLTLKHYTHLQLHDLSNELARVPSLSEHPRMNNGRERDRPNAAPRHTERSS